MIVKILEGMRIPVLQAPGYEADDLIGVWPNAEKEGFDVFMMTPDKDFAQLVSDKIRMYRPGRGGNPPTVWGPDEVRERYGPEDPAQARLVGVDGRLRRQHPRRARGRRKDRHQVPPGLRLHGRVVQPRPVERQDEREGEANRELAFLSRELATIVLDIPFDENFEDMAMSAPGGMGPYRRTESRTRRLLGDTATPRAPPT